jgi:hypothetical protein
VDLTFRNSESRNVTRLRGKAWNVIGEIWQVVWFVFLALDSRPRKRSHEIRLTRVAARSPWHRVPLFVTCVCCWPGVGHAGGWVVCRGVARQVGASVVQPREALRSLAGLAREDEVERGIPQHGR